MHTNTTTLEQPSRWERPLLAGGIVASLMFLVSMGLFIGLIAPHMPPFGATAPVKASFYATMAASPIYATIRFLIIAQLAPLALFYGALFGVLRRAEGGNGALAGAVFAAGLLGALLAPLAELVEGHMLLGLSAAGADPLVASGFDGMTPVAFGVSGLTQVVVLAGTGALLLAARQVPGWLGWFGYVAAVLGVFGAGILIAPQLFMVGTLSAILFKVWMVCLSVALLRRPAAHRSVPQRAVA